MLYQSKLDDLVNAFAFFSEPLKSKLDFSKKKLFNFVENKTYLYKYKYFAINLCADLLEIIDKLTKELNNDEIAKSKVIEEMRIYLKEICLKVENLTMI